MMRYKKVEKIEEKLSVIGLGCWGFSGSSVWDSSNDEDSIKTVHAAVDAGINFYDVAPIYGFGHAEEVLGKALQGGKREKVIIGSKCGLIWNSKREVKNCLTKESILKEIDESLRRLRTDYIDVYQLHWPDPNTEIEETVEAIQQLKNAGKIKYFGVTNFPLETTKKAMEYIEVSSQQGLYNMLERNPKTYHTISLEYRTEKEILPFCKENGQAFFPYSPLFQGLLTGVFNKQDNFGKNDVRNSNPKLNGDQYHKYYEAAEKLKEIAGEINRPLNELALNWLIQKEEITSIISGAQQVKHIQQNIKALEWTIDVDTMKAINKVLDGFIDE